MNQEYLSLKDARKLANYDKLEAERDRYKSDWNIVAQKLKETEKNYLKIVEEKNKEIISLKEELLSYKNKQMDIFEDNV